MRYLLMIYHSDAEYAKWSEEDLNAEYAAYNAFGEEAGKQVEIQSAAALRPASTATTVRVRNGEKLITDGPFAETKEQIGGYYLINARDLDQAIEIAAKIPTAVHGSIEVRPIAEFD